MYSTLDSFPKSTPLRSLSHKTHHVNAVCFQDEGLESSSAAPGRSEFLDQNGLIAVQAVEHNHKRMESIAVLDMSRRKVVAPSFTCPHK